MKKHSRYFGWVVGIILALIVVSAGLLFWKQPLLGKSLKQFNTQIVQTQQNQPVPTAITEISINSTVIPVTNPPVPTVVADPPVQKAVAARVPEQIPGKP